MDTTKLLQALDEYEKERIQILRNINAAQLSGEITPEMAQELRKEMK